MITLDMVKAGYEAEIIQLIDAGTKLGDGVACQIGDNWFYFGGQTAEEYSDVNKYKQDIPQADIVQSIFEVLKDFSTEFEDEYLYYEYFLREHGIDENVLVNNSEVLKPYRIAIRETYVREVEIYARDSVEAEQFAHDLCSEGKINLDYEDFLERDAECHGIARDIDLKIHEVYGKEDIGAGYADWKPYVLSRYECDNVVDNALSTIRGLGEASGSGYYGLKSFESCGDRFNLFFEICKLLDEQSQQPYFSVYYAVEFDEGDTLFADWVSTADLDLTVLKDKVYAISTTDFSQDIEKIIKGNSSLDEQIAAAKTQEVAPIKDPSSCDREER